MSDVDPSSPSTGDSRNGRTVHAMSIADDNAPPTSDLTTGSTYKRSNLRLYLAIAIAIVAVALLVGLLAGLLTRNSSSSSSPSSTYRAVAVQYMAIANSTNATQLLTANLAAYTAILASLASQQPDIVAFPEGGLGYLEADSLSTSNATITRQALLPFCTQLPYPAATPAPNPCLSPSSAASPANQLQLLSCLARPVPDNAGSEPVSDGAMHSRYARLRLHVTLRLRTY